MMEGMKHQQVSPYRISNPQPQPDSIEEVVNLRVKLVLAENDLKHERAAKDAMMNGFIMAIQALSGSGVRQLEAHTLAAPYSPAQDSQAIAKLEKEVERYRKENKGLRTKLRELSGNATPRTNHNSNGRTSVESSPPPGYKSISDAELGLDSKDKALDILQAERRFAHPGPAPTGLAGRWAHQQSLFQALSFGLSPSSNANLNADADANTSISTVFNDLQSFTQVPITNTLSTNDANNFVADIGLLSLEDILNDNEYGPSDLNAEPKQANEEDFPGLFKPADLDGEKDFDEQLEDQAKVMQKFNALPGPSVLKVETTVQGSFRGNEYDPTTMINAPKSPREWATDRNLYQNAPIYRHQRSEARDLDAENWREGENMNMKFPNALWNSREERDDALEGHIRACTARADTRFPDFFRYGIQYQPGELEGNFLRTVHIENLPKDVELREVLARVRGGDVLSAVLLDTKKLMGAMSARIVFKSEGSAEDFLSWTKNHALNFGENEDTVEAKVTLIETPTFPPCPRIKQKLGVSSRCICIPNFPPKFPIRSLEADIACHSQMRKEALLEIWLDEDNTLHLEFASLDMAGSATAILSSFRYYRELGLDIKSEVDPCSGPVEQLLDPIKPRPHLLPSNHSGISVSGRERAESGKSSGDDADSERENTEKKRHTFFSTKIEIPSFSGKALGSRTSWADEVEEELEAKATSSASATSNPLCLSSFQAAGGNHNHYFELSSSPRTATSGVTMGNGGIRSIDSVLAQAKDVSLMDDKIITSFGSRGLAGSIYATKIPPFSENHLHLHVPLGPQPCSLQKLAIYSPSKELDGLIGESDHESAAESETPTHKPTPRSPKPSQVGFAQNIRRKLALELRTQYNTQEENSDQPISSLVLAPFTFGEFGTQGSRGGSLSQTESSLDPTVGKGTLMIGKLFRGGEEEPKIQSSIPPFQATNMTFHNGMNPEEIALDSDSVSDF